MVNVMDQLGKTTPFCYKPVLVLVKEIIVLKVGNQVFTENSLKDLYEV